MKFPSSCDSHSEVDNTNIIPQKLIKSKPIKNRPLGLPCQLRTNTAALVEGRSYTRASCVSV